MDKIQSGLKWLGRSGAWTGSRLARFGSRLRRSFSARSWVYFLLHSLLVVTGAFLTVVADDSEWLIGVGTSLIATGVAGYVIYVYLLQTRDATDRLAMLDRFGFVDAFPYRSIQIKSEYDMRLAFADKQIDVLGFGLASLRKDYGFDTSLKEARRWAARAPVRILLIDPEFLNANGQTCADQRDIEENNEPGTIARQVQEFVQAVSELIWDPKIPFAVRLYRCLPTLNIFRIDDELFWGPYVIGGESRNTPTFIVRSPGIVFDRCAQHFDDIWNPAGGFSREPPAEWV